MATASTRKSVTLPLPRKTRLGQAMRRVNFVLTGPLENTTTTNCGVAFLFLRLVQHRDTDTVEVTYRSSLTNLTLSLWCGAAGGDPDEPRKASLKYRSNHAIPRAGSIEVKLDFLSNVPCWFELTSKEDEDGTSATNDCGDANTSDTFLVLPPIDDSTTSSLTALKVRQDDAGTPTTASSSTGPTATAGDSRGGGGGNSSGGLGAGAKAAIGVSITIVILSIVAMSAFLFLRRRRKGQETELAGAIIDHDRRSRRKGPEKRNNSAHSIASGESEEPLYPPIIQPVFDGFPGSMGYDDVRSLHSSLTNSHSPIHGPDSPTSLNNGGFWGTQGRSLEREELQAARLKAQKHTTVPTVVSYGPNPVTPTLTPRPSSRADLNKRAASNSPDSIEAIPHVPHIPVSIPDYIPDYANYSIPPPHSTPSPPRKPAAPVVVSYGPNRVTPTPVVVSPTVPPDDAMISRRFQEAGAAGGGIGSQQNNMMNDSPYRHERQFSWEAESPLLGASHMGPLPPYASTADFEAMEKGAVRKLAEPQAEAELPPTKDGFYHGYGAPDVVEYELPGAAPQNEPQLPFQPYKPRPHPPTGTSSSGNVGGYGEIEEQKFLLSDLLSDTDIRKLKEEKAKQKEKREREMREAKERGEEYDFGETMGEARARARQREREANGFGMR
ncbi:hypothetical protein QBC43DRAFT_63224 [Cladorrhinum sp. PSN259]|nr:hypothetical protein QBC43DRAFT_63224 [Cladorrhinum sp. PSN259]